MHMKFLTREPLYGYDVTVMKLARPALLNTKVRTVCLRRWESRAKPGKTCYVTGEHIIVVILGTGNRLVHIGDRQCTRSTFDMYLDYGRQRCYSQVYLGSPS